MGPLFTITLPPRVVLEVTIEVVIAVEQVQLAVFDEALVAGLPGQSHLTAGGRDH
ncbi:hypothetical protein D3C85_1470320 [compost metagenome]